MLDPADLKKRNYVCDRGTSEVLASSVILF